MNKLTPDEILFLILLFFVSLSLAIHIVNLMIKVKEIDNKKNKHNKINDIIKDTKKRIDKMNRRCK